METGIILPEKRKQESTSLGCGGREAIGKSLREQPDDGWEKTREISQSRVDASRRRAETVNSASDITTP